MTAIDDFRRRWEEDPSSRVFLQLAEEHRRAGDPKTAAEVLVKGLEANPRYLSARVALGRCHLELGEADAALGVLDEVVAEDGTHVVASRLLVETHLARRDAVRAKRQLENYRLLFSADPEISDFEQSIEEMLLSEAGAGEGMAEEVVASAETSREEEPSPEAQAAPSRARVMQHSEGQTLFAGLGDEAEIRRLDETFAGEGIFPIAVEESSTEAAPDPPAIEEPVAPWAVTQDDTHQLLPSDAQLGADAPIENPLGANDLLAELPVLAELEPLEATATDPPEDVLVEEAEIAPDEQETATLADLYLEQGHREEAERIFVRVLERDPDNELARRGLVSLQEGGAAPMRAARPLVAEDLLAEVEVDPRSGLTDKKIHLLRSYLNRIKRAHVS